MAKNEKEEVKNTVPAPEAGAAGANPDEAGIAILAYQLWLARGCPDGSDQEDWFLAERILKSRG